MKRRLFIFDMGGVMCTNTNVIDSICEELKLTKREFFEYAQHENFIKIQSGKMTMDEFWNEFSIRSGICVKEDYFKSFFEPQRQNCMYQLVDQLQKKSRVVAGTNTIESHYKIHMKNGDYDIFEKVYPSHLLKIAKPDPVFYKKILERESGKPEETIFIDDNTDNVKSASKIGIKAILFKSCEDLKERLDSII